MGVYIKDMEMPKYGRILIVFPSGRVLEVSADETQDIFEEAQAFPVPPHGRSIDADKFIKDECNNCDGACELIPCNCLNCTADCRCDFIKDIADAPTIIPGEEGE